jgi:hypothetical protein
MARMQSESAPLERIWRVKDLLAVGVFSTRGELYRALDEGWFPQADIRTGAGPRPRPAWSESVVLRYVDSCKARAVGFVPHSPQRRKVQAA